MAGLFSDRRKIAVGLAGTTAFLNLYAPQAVLPLLGREFGAGAAALSPVMTAATLSIALTAPFTGAIADVLGRKRVITIALCLLMIPTLMIPLSGSLDVLIFWRFVQGLLLPPVFVVMVAYIGDEFSASEATAMTGIYVAASALGGFSGRFVTGLLTDQIGWRGAFFADAALTALCGLGIVALLPREKKFVRAKSMTASLAQMLKHMRNHKLLGIYAVGFGVLFNFIATFTYVNFLLAAPPYGLSPSALGLIFVVYLFGTIASPLVGRAVRAYGRRHVVGAALVAWICGILLTLIPSLPVIICGLALAATCGMVCQTSSTSYVAVTAKGGVSSAVGLYVLSFYVGGAAGGLLPGLVWQRFGWPSTVMLVVVVLAAMLAIVWGLWTKDRPGRPVAVEMP